MVKIINYEKEKIKEKRKQIEEEINKKNKEVRKHNSIIWTIYLFAIMALGAGLFCSIKYIHFDVVFAALGFMTFSVVGFLIVMLCLDDEWCWNDYKQTALKYTKTVEGKNVLDAKVVHKDTSYIRLTLEDPDTHVVTEKDIYDWDEKVRTDIGEIIVDVVNESIYIPYKVEPRI